MGRDRDSDRYQVYLLRLWRDAPALPWRATLLLALTGEERHFATLEALFVFLHEQATGDTPR